jgi:hypothetical protein
MLERQKAMNTPGLLKRQRLNHGLNLEFWDHSRPMAGDRWLVSLEVRMAVPVREETLPPELQGDAAAVIGVLGEEVVFTRTEERHFIAASEAARCLEDMQNRVLAQAPVYFGRLDFPARLIRKKYAEQQELAWRRQADAGESRE